VSCRASSPSSRAGRPPWSPTMSLASCRPSTSPPCPDQGRPVSGMISGMTELPSAYYLPLGDDRFEPTVATTSPWDDGAQHGGRPTALLADCLDQAFGRPELRVARISMDFLGPVPCNPVQVRTELLPPGRRAQLSQSALGAGARQLATARVWHLAAAPVEGITSEGGTGLPVDLPGPQ